MIVASLLLIVVAVTLLGLGTIDGANGYLIGSIAASLLAAVTLIASGRRITAPGGSDQAARPEEPRRDRRSSQRGSPAGPAGGRRGRVPGTEAARIPVGAAAADVGGGSGGGGGMPATGAASSTSVLALPAVVTPYPALRVLDIGDLLATDDVEDLADEPSAELTSAGDSARIARLNLEVLVIDRRPRYHLRSCLHLLGRPCERLPAREAIELGFTPCGLCEPDVRLLGRSGRP